MILYFFGELELSMAHSILKNRRLPTLSTLPLKFLSRICWASLQFIPLHDADPTLLQHPPGLGIAGD